MTRKHFFLFALATAKVGFPSVVLIREEHSEAANFVGQRGDPFVKIALVIETVVWCVIGYAVNVYLENMITKNDIYLNIQPMIWKSIVFGGAGFLVLNFLFWLALKGSSRAHRVLIFSVLALLIAAPTSAFQLLSDYNRSQDDSLVISEIRKVNDGRIIEHRGRKRRKTHTYHLYFSDNQSLALANGKVIILPSAMQVDPEIFQEAMRTKTLEIGVKQGRLGFPWYESIGNQSMDL